MSKKHTYELQGSSDTISFEFDSLEERDCFREKLNRLLTIYRKQLLQELQGKMNELEAIETRL